jgi:GNAT superfamily N-acetyltransferase
MIAAYTPTDLPQTTLTDSLNHIILLSHLQRQDEEAQFYAADHSVGVYHPHTGFMCTAQREEDIIAWAKWIYQHKTPLIAGELNTHYRLLQAMGDITPPEGVEALCRYEIQIFCPFPGTAAPFENLPIVKQATPQDLDKLYHFYQRAEGMEPRSKNSLLQTLERDRLFYATKMGKIVAAALTHCETDQAALIGGVYTQAAHRGKGYSHACVQALVQALQQAGKTPCLFYEQNNQAAANLYRKMGFVPQGKWIIIELTYQNAS